LPSSRNGANGGNNYFGAGGGTGGIYNSAGPTAGTNGGGGGGGGQGSTNAQGAANGGAGTEWDASHGSGGGAGGRGCATVAGNGANGGLYGAGGSGACNTATGAGGSGAQGIVVLTYSLTQAGFTLTGNVKFLGSLLITGALSKSSGTFAIDNPIDPRNSILYHSFVESPEAKNVYNGTATLDGAGAATIQLPDYFDALNGEVRYQFAPLGQAMPDLHVSEEEHDNHFSLAGGVPGGRVSWQVTGVRHDPYILLHPIIVEELKGADQIVQRGQCIFALACE
jgi:hypothetical protein